MGLQTNLNKDTDFLQTCLEEILQTGAAVTNRRRHDSWGHVQRRGDVRVNSVSHNFFSSQTHTAQPHASLSSPPPLFSEQTQTGEIL